jgi:hypothetical protein
VKLVVSALEVASLERIDRVIDERVVLGWVTRRFGEHRLCQSEQARQRQRALTPSGDESQHPENLTHGQPLRASLA